MKRNRHHWFGLTGQIQERKKTVRPEQDEVLCGKGDATAKTKTNQTFCVCVCRPIKFSNQTINTAKRVTK